VAAALRRFVTSLRQSAPGFDERSK